MREGLREIASQPSCGHIVFLGHQANVVPQAREPLEQMSGLLFATRQNVGVGEPERTRQEGPFPVSEARFHLGRIMAHDESILKHPALDRLHGTEDSLIVWREETGRGDYQEASVQPV